MMLYKIFFSDFTENKILDACDARQASKDEILHSMDCVLHMPNNFLGIIDKNGVTLQFMVNTDKSVYIDIPVPKKNGSYAKTAELQSCFSIVQELDKEIVIATIDGLAFNSWGRIEPIKKPWWKIF